MGESWVASTQDRDPAPQNRPPKNEAISSSKFPARLYYDREGGPEKPIVRTFPEEQPMTATVEDDDDDTAAGYAHST
jgi:hypothetical protein